MMKPHIRMGLTKEKEKEKSKETDTAPHTVICLFVLLGACMSIPLIPDKGASPLVVLRHREHRRVPAQLCLPWVGGQDRGGLLGAVREEGRVLLQSLDSLAAGGAEAGDVFGVLHLAVLTMAVAGPVRSQLVGHHTVHS
jgi:hypothetical protein